MCISKIFSLVGVFSHNLNDWKQQTYCLKFHWLKACSTDLQWKHAMWVVVMANSNEMHEEHCTTVSQPCVHSCLLAVCLHHLTFCPTPTNQHSSILTLKSHICFTQTFLHQNFHSKRIIYLFINNSQLIAQFKIIYFSHFSLRPFSMNSLWLE